MARLGISERLPLALQQRTWVDLWCWDWLFVGLGWGGRLAFGLIDGWMEMVSLGWRWFLCIALSNRRSALSPLAVKPVPSLVWHGFRR